MSDDKNLGIIPEPSEEEKKSEEEIAKEPKQEEVRNSIIEKYGLDNELQSELIDKLTNDALEDRKKLSTAIKQKVTWRTKFNEVHTEPKKEEKPQPDKQIQVPSEEIINQKINEAFENKELGNTGLPDEVQKEIKAYAKASGISIKKAMESDFYTFKKTKYEEAKRNDEASAGKGKGSPSRQEFSFDSPPKVDMTTPEGQKTWEDYKAWRKTQK